ncbi:HsdR family type I site-specific deoxyribonuclease [Flavobacterium sp. MC2016-06]|jgi:type I restriction enzyme R subunit|uniref:type I restriction endonuclease subunit R n=1 Tax=Flavobacterium sp. MC2016-06 TaxID=2676308 RepID=UPI0012BAD219|nr:HsdR family type I site-specific deoxyribonuclease [Flavobacterium sp. MC2016-06]MBU3860150.1 HsdR family type I site-specific deoxyribonuclease [Flavobacterium sp. MC2016-06]
MKFTESQLEQAFIHLLQEEKMTHLAGGEVRKIELNGVSESTTIYGHVVTEKVLLTEDFKNYLRSQYSAENITESEIESIVRSLERLPASDLYESNKTIIKMISDGFLLKREDRNQKDFYVQLIDYSERDNNSYKIVNQLAIKGYEMRIPDLILYINGLPLVVFEFKTAIEENTTLHDAYIQVTTRYKRDIPELFKYNAFCVISDGANTKAGSFFAPYEFFYAWRKIAGMPNEVDGIDAMFTLIQGMFNRNRLRDIIQNFIYLPDSSKKNEKIVCRYPQYYAATKLFENIKQHQKPLGDGKGGTYFGTTGCGKSFTMLYLSRLLMRSKHFASPTIVIITDRTDLDDQLSGQFTNAKGFIGDQSIISVESRSDLRELLQGRNSGGVFLTTIHKFTEDTKLLTDRTNVICISDEAHRSQTNLDQKVKVTEKGVKKSFGFAKHLHDSLPNATYVGFTGTPIDATIDVFGEIVDAYTMNESVQDEITVRIVYEGRAAKVLLNNQKLAEIEVYYNQCAEEGSNENQVEESKKAMSQMNAIIGDPTRLQTVAEDFIAHYENRISEGSTVKGKAIFVCSNRPIAYELYKNILELRPEWSKEKITDDDVILSDKDKKEIKPMERIKMVMTRGKDDSETLYHLLGTKEDRKELDRQFKNEKSNFKIAIVVDMWLTGFDVPFLDTMYIDKPIQRHNLIQTISRVNRKFEGKQKGLVVDYIGIKKQMNMAMALYNNADNQNIEDIEQSVVAVKDQLDLLGRLFHKFDKSGYFSGTPLEQLKTLNQASEFIQLTQELEKRFMYIVKRLKSAYDICSGSRIFSEIERDEIHFYLAVRSIIFKLTKGVALDTAQMNNRVKQMLQDAIESNGVEEIFKLGEDNQTEVDIFSDDYMAKINKIKLPNTKIKLLQKLLAKAIDDVKKINKITGVDFSKRLQFIVDKYNERKESDVLRSEVLEDFTDEIIDLYYALKKEKESFKELGIDFEEKAFYDILKSLAIKYDFIYPEDKLVVLAQKVKVVVDDKAKYTDWSKREDIKAELKVGLIILLAENGYPPVDRDEVYKEIFEQAENFKKYQKR